MVTKNCSIFPQFQRTCFDSLLQSALTNNNLSFANVHFSLTGQDLINDYGMAEDKVQRSLFFPYFQEILKLPRVAESNNVAAPIRNHRLQLRDGPLKFRLNDGNLRIGRGFGKRSFFIDTTVDDSKSGINRWVAAAAAQRRPIKLKFPLFRCSFDSVDVLKALSQLKSKDSNKEET
jgi:hypothetical protein